MPNEIKRIALSMPFGLGGVNAYLLKTKKGFILIDTGSSNQRGQLEKELERAGCKSGNLPLIILTHGDFDHTGNAAYLRQKFGSEIAIGEFDSGMLERGDMFWNRKQGNALIRILAPILIGFGKTNWIKPDVNLHENMALTKYGLQGKILSIPGHSKGSIGILTNDGGLFCGDLLDNRKQVGVTAILDDLEAAKASIEKLKKLDAKMVYPGHGEPFPFSKIQEIQL
jgi:hydroxyacylglutathione hydrolase